jgi:hypothetical protein
MNRENFNVSKLFISEPVFYILTILNYFFIIIYKYVVFVSFFVVVVLNPFLLNYRTLINSVVFTIN